MWRVPKLDDELIERTEDVLARYERPYDANGPVVCLGEKSVQRLNDRRRTVRVKNGSIRRDYEYVRRGIVNVFLGVEPNGGRHFTKVTRNRKKAEFARMIRDIAGAYSKARTIHLEMENLSTHFIGSSEHAFGKKEAKRLWSRFTIHYTPKHASWLDQAEIAIGIFNQQCLGRRCINSLESLRKDARAWNRRMNRVKAKIDWRFTVKDAREKFRYKRLMGKMNLSRQLASAAGH